MTWLPHGIISSISQKEAEEHLASHSTETKFPGGSCKLSKALNEAAEQVEGPGSAGARGPGSQQPGRGVCGSKHTGEPGSVRELSTHNTHVHTHRSHTYKHVCAHMPCTRACTHKHMCVHEQVHTHIHTLMHSNLRLGPLSDAQISHSVALMGTGAQKTNRPP